MKKLMISILFFLWCFAMSVHALELGNLPVFPEVSQKHYVVYREGSRNNRIEVAFFDIKNENEDDCLVWDDSLQLYDNSKYTNSVKYYLDGEEWVLFEKDYPAISNYPASVIETDLDVVNYVQYKTYLPDMEIIAKPPSPYSHGQQSVKPIRWNGKHYMREIGDVKVYSDGIHEIMDLTNQNKGLIDGFAIAGDNIMLFRYIDLFSISPWSAGSKYGNFNNSPMVVLDADYNVIGEKTYAGCCYYMCTLNGRVYFRTEDYSKIDYYTDLAVVQTAEVVQRIEEKTGYNYYYTDDGLDWTEITKEEAEEAVAQSEKQTAENQNTYTGYNFLKEEGQNCLQPKSNLNVTYPIVYENNATDARYMVQHKDKLFDCFSYNISAGKKTNVDNKKTQDRQYGVVSLDGVYGVVVPGLVYNCEVWCTEEYMYVDNQTEYYKIPMSHFTENILVILDGKVLGFINPPVVENDRTLVPMRFLFEQMGDTVTWNEETMTATASNGENTIVFGIDNVNATVNGETEIMDVPARLINDKTYVPLRFLSENLGYTVTWDEATGTASIITK